jgi:hypothetical protein
MIMLRRGAGGLLPDGGQANRATGQFIKQIADVPASQVRIAGAEDAQLSEAVGVIEVEQRVSAITVRSPSTARKSVTGPTDQQLLAR